MASRWVKPSSAIASLLAVALVSCARQRGGVPAAQPSAAQPIAANAVAPTPPGEPTSTGPAPTTTTVGPGTTATPSAPTIAAPRTFTVIGAGDILLHKALWQQGARDANALGSPGYDFGPLLASVRPAVSSADLAICHIESQFGPPAGPFAAFPLFSVPPQIGAAVAQTGYDSCSTASNHSIDSGEAGIDRTLDALDRAGVRHAGTARSASEAATPTLLRVRGVVVAHLSYSFGFNGLRRPTGKQWLANLLDPDAVLAQARRAREAGAEVLIVSIHWGTEYSHTPNSQQTSVAKRLLASPDVDLILGHHTHVVQPLERIGDKWVAYSMGNEVAYQHFSNDTRYGIMPRFTFTEVAPGVFRATLAEVLPIHMWLDGKPTRVYDVAAALADPNVSEAVKASCRASHKRTLAILGRLGAYNDGLIVAGGSGAA